MECPSFQSPEIIATRVLLGKFMMGLTALLCVANVSFRTCGLRECQFLVHFLGFFNRITVSRSRSFFWRIDWPKKSGSKCRKGRAQDSRVVNRMQDAHQHPTYGEHAKLVRSFGSREHPKLGSLFSFRPCPNLFLLFVSCEYVVTRMHNGRVREPRCFKYRCADRVLYTLWFPEPVVSIKYLSRKTEHGFILFVYKPWYE